MSRINSTKGLNWSVERRYKFIEFRLYWQGKFNRIDLIVAFGNSVQQASKDLNSYKEECPGNLTYGTCQLTYLRSENFKPIYSKPDAAEYFAQLQAVQHGLVPEEQSWLRFFPGYAATPISARGVDPEVLREVVSAIHKKNAVQITDQSMSRPNPTIRWIEPHALAFDEFRWHACAICQNDSVFKDFLLSRIVEVGEGGNVSSAAKNDIDWHAEVVLEIGTHTELSDTQRRAIEMDYGMVAGKAEIVVRKALLFYALKRLGLDMDPTTRRPSDRQFVLMSKTEKPARQCEKG